MAIGPDTPERMRQFWQEHTYTFPAIADPSGKILTLLGQEVNWFKLGRMPALLAVNPEGEVVFQYRGNSMRDLPSLNDAAGVLGL